MEKLKFNYDTNYTKAVDAEWVARQFKIYDKFVREYYDPRNLLNNFDGTSYDSKGNVEYNIVHLGFVEVLEGGNAFFRNISVEQSLKITGNSVLAGKLAVDSSAHLYKDLEVNEATTVGGNALLKSNLNVKKDTTLNGNLYVDRDTLIKGEIEVVKDSYLYNNLTVGRDTSLQGNLTIGKEANVKSDLSLDGEFVKKGVVWDTCEDDSLSSLII